MSATCWPSHLQLFNNGQTRAPLPRGKDGYNEGTEHADVQDGAVDCEHVKHDVWQELSFCFPDFADGVLVDNETGPSKQGPENAGQRDGAEYDREACTQCHLRRSASCWW